jgi:DNA-binding transcriptional ArsR family regulator
MDAFVALAEPTRRQILEFLAAGERAAGDIVEALPKLTQPAVSRHLRVLRESGLVSTRADAQRRIYTLEPAGLKVVEVWLSRYRTFWNDHLTRLEAQLREDQSR